MTAILRTGYYPRPVIVPVEEFVPRKTESDHRTGNDVTAGEAENIRDPEWLAGTRLTPAEGFVASHPEFEMTQPVWIADRAWHVPIPLDSTDWEWHNPLTRV